MHPQESQKQQSVTVETDVTLTTQSHQLRSEGKQHL